MSPRNKLSLDRYRPVCRLAAVLGSTLIIAAFLPEVLGVGAPGLGGMQVSMLMTAASCFLIATTLGKVDGRLLLVTILSLSGFAGLLGIVSLTGSDLGWMIWNLKTRISPTVPLDIHQVDSTLGWRNRPGAVAKDQHYDYSVTYTIDAAGHREHRKPESDWPVGPIDGRPLMICLGGSFTFGQGVEDDQSYPFLIEQLINQKHEVINAGVNGWGTVQSMLYLQRLIDQQYRPAVATYGFIPAHIVRNADRSSWLEILALSDRRKPIVHFQDGIPKFDGLVGVGEGASDSDALDLKEAELTIQSIAYMQQLCQNIDCKFFCLILGNDSAPGTPEFTTSRWLENELALRGISKINLLDVPSDRFPHDGHPTSNWHRAVAERVRQKVFMDKE